MKLHKIFNLLFVVSLVVIVASFPLITAQAAPVIQDTQPVVDWNQVIAKILTFVIPLLATALTVQGFASARYWWGKLKLEHPDIVDLIQQAALFAVPVIEQLRKNGTIPDYKTAKEDAMKLAMAWLSEKGFDIYAIEPYLKLLDAAIEGAVHALNNDRTTVTLTPLPDPELR